MDWHELLRMPEGEEVDYDPKMLDEVAPIIAISETVRPVLVAVLRLPNGDDFLYSLLYDRKRNAYQKRGRYRRSSGDKKVFPPSAWLRPRSPEVVERDMEYTLRDLQQKATELDGTVSPIRLSPQATDDELLQAFVDNGSFDVLRLNPDTHKAEKLK
ncbi:MAG: hypothetical protein AB7P69_18890 [Candidatus Binatia bacterium]